MWMFAFPPPEGGRDRVGDKLGNETIIAQQNPLSDC